MGIEQLRKGASVRQSYRHIKDDPYTLAILAEAYGRAGQPEMGLDTVAEALSLADAVGARYWDAELHRLQGELLLARSAEYHSEAEDCLRRATAIARSQNAKSFELRSATSLARLRRDQRKFAEARELLAPIFGWFTEGFNTSGLKNAKALLDELS